MFTWLRLPGSSLIAAKFLGLPRRLHDLSQHGVLAWNHIFNSHLVNEASGAISRLSMMHTTESANKNDIVSELGITGTAWHECVTPRVPAVGRSVNHYYAWRPSAPLTPGWLFRGTGLTAAARVGGIVGYELDRTDANSPPGIQIVGSGTTPCQGNRPPLGVSQTTLYRAAT